VAVDKASPSFVVGILTSARALFRCLGLRGSAGCSGTPSCAGDQRATGQAGAHLLVEMHST
jgi:hypothetical protein